MELIIENVRSFCGRHSIPIKPLTLLVGENSTGKSTFLAMLAHVSQAGFPSFRPSFNTPPFDLGTYDSIATFRGGRYGRSGSFSIGFIRDGGPAEEKVLATYTNSLGQPQLSELVAVWKENELRFESDGPASYSGKATWTRKGELQKPVPVNFKNWELGAMEVPLVVALQFHCLQTLSPKGFPGAITAPQKVFLPASALAPVRTKPRRTYDEISDEFKPEGDHIPVLLAHMWQQ